MSKRFLGILVAVALVLIGVYWVSHPKNSTGSSTNSQPSSHIEGSGKKGVTLIEYGDYQCPACGAYYPIVKQVFDKYKSDIYFQFRNFPLVQLHPNAMAGARAAEAAGLQGKYWEMHDMLYEQQQTWSGSNNPSQIFEDYATQLSLNVEKFRTDMNSASINSVINADIQAGQAIGTSATPTFQLDGKKLDTPPRDLEGFSKIIDAEIAAKNKS